MVERAVLQSQSNDQEDHTKDDEMDPPEPSTMSLGLLDESGFLGRWHGVHALMGVLEFRAVGFFCGQRHLE